MRFFVSDGQIVGVSGRSPEELVAAFAGAAIGVGMAQGSM
jgi:hypothetical protein